MATGTRLPLAEAEAVAEEIADLLRPACMQLAIAGSIRRRKPDVGDIEILAIPYWQPRLDLFGDSHNLPPTSKLELTCSQLIEHGILRPRLDVHGRAANGPKYKRLFYKDVPLDLFSADPDNWGLLLVIRTGPAAYSKRLVTERRLGGWLPASLKVKDGYLWRVSPDRSRDSSSSAKIPVPSEASLYALLGRPYDPPESRTDP